MMKIFSRGFFLIISIIFIFPFQVFTQPGCPSINAGVDQNVTCSSNCANLTSTYLATGATTSYAVSSIPYSPPYAYNAGTALLVNIDDTWSSVLTIPFTFCFFGNAYTQLVGGSNGCITFNLAEANTSCAWSFTASCPDPNIISGSIGPYILAPYHDIDPAVTGDMYYNTYGSSPCRTFVVSWNQVAMYSSSCNFMLATHMVVLYESTNVIEVYIQNKPLCTTWNSGNAVIGIQDLAGTTGYVPPGRNTGQWTASNEAWRFTPNGATNYVVSWWQGGTQIAAGSTTTVCPATTTTYDAQIVYTNCVSPQITVTDQMTVNVGSSMTVGVSASANPVCAGTSSTLTASGGTTYSWSGGLGTANPVTVTPASTTTYTVTGTTAGCTGTASITVNVNPGPTVNISASANPVCAGNSTTLTASGGTTYSWSGGLGTSNPITVSPASATTYTVTGTTAGCTGTASITVNVNPNPTVNISASANPICAGTSTTLTASGGTTYSWSGGLGTSNPVTVSPVSATTYTVTGTSAGCTGTASITININPSLTVSISASANPICAGTSTTLTAGGGTTYSWSGGLGTSNPVTVSPASATTYTVTGTSAGCTGTASITINVNPIPTADAGLPQTICSGSLALLTAGGGGTYQWDTGPMTQSITVNPASTTTYTVTVTSIGCTASDNVIVTVNPIPLADAGLPQTICPGFPATLTASGGSSYLWNTGLTTASITVSPATTTTYSVTVSDLGCSATDDVTVTVSAGIIADAGLPQTICSGQSATFIASGGVSYQWSNGDFTQSITVSPIITTTYTVTASSGACSGTDNVTLTVNATPTAIAGTDQIICIGQSVNLTAFGGGTYLWSNSSPNQSTNVSPTITTLFTVTVTSAAGCTASDDVQVTVNPLPNVSAGTDQSICYGNSTMLNASGGVQYEWNPTINLSNPFAANPIANPTTTTTYTVTVTDANGCSSTDAMTLTVNLLPIASAGPDQSICFGSSTILNASGGINYLWSPGTGLTPTSVYNPTANPTSTTVYTVTVTDANNCFATDDIIITVNPVPTSAFTLTSPVCVGQTSDIVYTGTATPSAMYSWDFDGGIIVSGAGQGPYQISWSNPSTYNISLTVSENGCTSTTTTISQIVGQLNASIAVTDSITCFGANDGTATVTASGALPYQYMWSNMQMGATAQGLSANTLYCVTVTDNNGCTASQCVTLSQPPQLTMNFSYTNVSCYGGSNGIASASVSGGTTPYQYGWLPIGTAGNVNSVTTLHAGTYTFMVYDAHGCTLDTTFTVSQPPLLTYTYVTDSVSCNSLSDGSINIILIGGNPPYAYSWSPGVSTGPSASNLSAGTYNVTMTDHNGCDTSVTITIEQPLPLVLSTSGNVAICNGQSTIISSFASGGTGAYTFNWDNGLGIGNTFNVNPLTTTTYTVSVTDQNGCTAPSQSLTVTVSPPISVSVMSLPSSLCLGESTVLTANANGGNGNYTYTWGAGIGISTSSIIVIPLSTTTYPVTVTDNCNSPQDVDSVTITVFPLPQVQFISDSIHGCEPLLVSFSDQSTPTIANWLWNFGDTQSGSNNISTQQNPSHLFSTAGLYTVTLSVSTTDGCDGSITYQNMIEVYPTPDAYFYYDPQTISILNPNVNFIDMSAGASTWNWNFGDPASMSSNSSDEPSPSHYFSNPGTYYITLVITSQYGCTDSASTDIIVNSEFTFYIPNAFTPDGNGKNDFFFPQGDWFDPNNYELYVFDRWGEIVFKTNNFSEYWDGKVMGGNKIAQQGVYTWIIIVKDLGGDMHNFNGRVTLLRK
ncbi:MAG: PKD domain-containing protein [Bacteroidota bacterium]